MIFFNKWHKHILLSTALTVFSLHGAGDTQETISHNQPVIQNNNELQAPNQETPHDEQETPREEKEAIVRAARERFINRVDPSQVPGIRLENLQKLDIQCHICLGDFIYDADDNHVGDGVDDPDQYVTLSNQVGDTQAICTHAYHTSCISRWLNEHPQSSNCFLCTQPAFTQENLTLFRIIHNGDEYASYRSPNTDTFFMDENNKIRYFNIDQGHDAFWGIMRLLRNFTVSRILFYSHFHLLNNGLAINPNTLPLLLCLCVIAYKPGYPLNPLPNNDNLAWSDLLLMINNQAAREATYHVFGQIMCNLPNSTMSELNGFLSMFRFYSEAYWHKNDVLSSYDYLKYCLRKLKRVINNMPQNMEQYRVQFMNNINLFAAAAQHDIDGENNHNNEQVAQNNQLAQQQDLFNRLLQTSNTIGRHIYQAGTTGITQARNSFTWLTGQARRFTPTITMPQIPNFFRRR